VDVKPYYTYGSEGGSTAVWERSSLCDDVDTITQLLGPEYAVIIRIDLPSG
jgi:hypothetical protein